MILLEAVSVSALTKYLQAKFTRDIHLQHVKLRGEISNVKFHNKGHLYFTLKDEYAKISGVIFAQTLNQLQLDTDEIIDGIEVEVEGSIRVYEGNGTYQMYGSQLKRSGIGALQREYERLFVHYKERGYFDDAHKKIVPRHVQKLALITASDGAAIEDMKQSITEHIPHVQMKLFPTLVQGENAPEHIAKAIEKADKGAFDAIIVGRGGGSLEDLWAFNSGAVLEAIYHAKTPIISAVGHEIDTMLSDYVADVRALTPTAAIYYFQATQAMQADILQMQQMATQQMQRRLQLHFQTLQLAKHQLKELDPKYKVERQKAKLEFERLRLSGLSPLLSIEAAFLQLKQIQRQLMNNIEKRMRVYENDFANEYRRLHLLNPKSQLERGYALVYEGEQIITKVADIQDEYLTLQLQDGQIYVKVVEKNGENKR